MDRSFLYIYNANYDKMKSKEGETMDIVISRILKYLNGCLDNDYMYKIGLFIVQHYIHMEDYTLDQVMKEGQFQKEDIIDFCKHLGFDSFEDFQQQLIADYILRVSQIRARMIGVRVDDLIEQLDQHYHKEELMHALEQYCEFIFHKKRIVLVGALYPMSIAVEFQTDFITFGKEVIQYHHFDNDFQFNEDDLVIFMSATGRTLKAYLNENGQYHSNATIILFTQNAKYKKHNDLKADYVLQVPGRFDGIQFNYQIMLLLDILRIYYYQKYYIDA